MNKKLTIFTPTYNRVHTLSRVYDSIIRQDKKLLCQVEWLIIDDGSTDDTEVLVSTWINKILPFELRYIKQVNGGKHTAFNRAVKEAKGEFFFAVDSDDWLTDNSISHIVEIADRISNVENLAGIIALKCFPNGKLIGNSYPENIINSSAYELYLMGHGGERSIVLKTDIIKHYPFPVIPGEIFCTECVVYDQIDLKYKYVVSNYILTVCEYQEGGLTSNLFPLMIKNAVGYKIYYAQRINMAVTLKERIGYAIRYNAFNLIKREFKFSYIGQHKFLVMLTIPLGYIASKYYRKNMYVR